MADGYGVATHQRSRIEDRQFSRRDPDLRQQSNAITLPETPAAEDHGGTTGHPNGMGGGASSGLGPSGIVAIGNLLSTQSRPSPTDRRRGDDPGRKGSAPRRGCSLRSA